MLLKSPETVKSPRLVILHCKGQIYIYIYIKYQKGMRGERESKFCSFKKTFFFLVYWYDLNIFIDFREGAVRGGKFEHTRKRNN